MLWRSLAVVALAGGLFLVAGLNPNSQHRGSLARRGYYSQQRRATSLRPTTLMFEPNEGQFPTSFDFEARSSTFSLYLSKTGLTFKAIRSSQTGDILPKNYTLRSGSPPELRFIGTNANPTIRGLQKLQSISNYFRGSDPNQWIKRVPNYSRVEYDKLYPGVRLDCHGSNDGPELDWIVEPGADVGQIRFSVSNATPTVDANGSLTLKLSDGEISMKRPIVYQEGEGTKVMRAAEYTISVHNEISFKIRNYDPTRQLVIDPVLVYSTFFGGDIGIANTFQVAG